MSLPQSGAFWVNILGRIGVLVNSNRQYVLTNQLITLLTSDEKHVAFTGSVVQFMVDVQRVCPGHDHRRDDVRAGAHGEGTRSQSPETG